MCFEMATVELGKESIKLIHVPLRESKVVETLGCIVMQVEGVHKTYCLLSIA